MASSIRTARSSFREDEGGAVMVETAFVFVLFFVILWGIITYGVIFALDHTMNAAASEGARAAVATLDEAEAIAVAQATTAATLGTFGSNAANAVIAVVPSDCVAPANTRCLTVTVTYPWDTAPIIPAIMQFAAPDTITSSATVQLSH